MSDDEKYKPFAADKSDVAHAVARSVFGGAMLYAGTASVELLNAIVTPPLERRRNKWMKELGEALRLLEEQMHIVLKSLQERDSFIDTALEASQIAIKTNNEEKRSALKNAILNSTLPNAPEESMQKMFLSFVDTIDSLAYQTSPPI